MLSCDCHGREKRTIWLQAVGVDYDRGPIMLTFWIFSPLFLYTPHGVQKSGMAWESRRFCLGMAASVAKVSCLSPKNFLFYRPITILAE
jgi:hypothetical protein